MDFLFSTIFAERKQSQQPKPAGHQSGEVHLIEEAELVDAQCLEQFTVNQTSSWWVMIFQSENLSEILSLQEVKVKQHWKIELLVYTNSLVDIWAYFLILNKETSWMA